MGDWPRVIYDKMPMFFGTIMSLAYLAETEISFLAVGGNAAPLQVCSFAKGVSIDDELKKLWINGSGGNGLTEHYSFVPYYLNRHADFSNASAKPFFFLIGDAMFAPNVTANSASGMAGLVESPAVTSQEWTDLMDKTHFFHLHKFYCSANWATCERCISHERQVRAQWDATVGPERIVQMAGTEQKVDNTNGIAKACVDVMLGIISMVSGARSLEEYVADMEERGQDEARIAFVRAKLAEVAVSVEADRKAFGLVEDADDLA